MVRALWLSIGLLAALSLLVAACGAAPSTSEVSAETGELAKNADGYTDISVEQLATMLESKDFTLVNVHIPYEGEIPRTDLFIPFDEIAAYQDQLPDKDTPIVLYCRSGSMSTSAAQELSPLGYTNVLEVDGGFNAWKAAGYELLDKGR
jgi:rhodanese-related sulfurtransferase